MRISENGQNPEEEKEGEFVGGSDEVDEGILRGIPTIVSHELEVEGVDDEAVSSSAWL